MTSVLILYNNTSGNQDKESLVDQLLQTLIKSGISQEFISRMQPKNAEQAFQLAKEGSQRRIDLVVAIGGDGTLNLVAGGIQAGGGYSKLGILPAGSVNNFARALGIPLEMSKAIDTLLTGIAKPVDICQVNDRYMLSSLVIGTVADLSADVTSKDKRKFGKLAFFKNIFKSLTRNSRYHLRLTYQGRSEKVTTRFLLLAMTPSIAGLSILGSDVTADDGLLNGYYTEHFRPWKILSHFKEVRQGDFSELFKMTTFKTDSLVIESRRDDENPEARIDGDPAGALPLKLTVHRRSLLVMVPKSDEDRQKS